MAPQGPGREEHGRALAARWCQDGRIPRAFSGVIRKQPQRSAIKPAFRVLALAHTTAFLTIARAGASGPVAGRPGAESEEVPEPQHTPALARHAMDRPAAWPLAARPQPFGRAGRSMA